MGLNRKVTLLVFVICTLSVSTSYGAKLSGIGEIRDDDDDERPCWHYSSDDCDDDIKLGTGAIVGIIIATLILFFGIPILLCFCCAWCCFKNCRGGGKTKATQIVVAAPIAAQYQQPQAQPYPAYGATGANPNAYQTGGYPVAPYPVQQHQPQPQYYSNPNDENIYEQPPAYFDVAAPGQHPQQKATAPELGWTTQKS